jgi:hypothetical protein
LEADSLCISNRNCCTFVPLDRFGTNLRPKSMHSFPNLIYRPGSIVPRHGRCWVRHREHAWHISLSLRRLDFSGASCGDEVRSICRASISPAAMLLEDDDNFNSSPNLGRSANTASACRIHAIASSMGSLRRPSGDQALGLLLATWITPIAKGDGHAGQDQTARLPDFNLPTFPAVPLTVEHTVAANRAPNQY